jgi:hypothetical protein
LTSAGAAASADLALLEVMTVQIMNARYTNKQGQYLAFIYYYTKLNVVAQILVRCCRSALVPASQHGNFVPINSFSKGS